MILEILPGSNWYKRSELIAQLYRIDGHCCLIYFVLSINHIQSDYQSNIEEVCSRSEVDQIEAYGELRLRHAS